MTLFLGQNPEIQNYDLSSLRQHIRYCLSNCDILPFPVKTYLIQNKNIDEYHNSEQCLLASYFQHQQLQQTLHAAKSKKNNVTLIYKRDRYMKKMLSTLTKHLGKTSTNKLIVR
jgi:predicted transcriptional regulator